MRAKFTIDILDILFSEKEVIMRSIKNFFAPADLVNVHIPET